MKIVLLPQGLICSQSSGTMSLFIWIHWLDEKQCWPADLDRLFS